MSDIKKLLGKKIKQLRKEKNLTQEELAELIEIETPSMSNIERGKFAPSVETLQKLSNVLNVGIWEFYYFDNLSNEEMIARINSKMKSKPDLVKLIFNFLKAVE